jgi:ornithine cyclodeaminase
MWLPDKRGLLGMMPGYASSLGVMGVKLISVFHGNHKENLPSHQGVVILFDDKHGTPLMIFDAGEITAIRTAAASAVATKLLSREDSSTLAVIGSGEQARRHIEAMLCVRKIDSIRCWSRTEENANALCENISGRFNVAFNVCSTVREAVSKADIICTVTSSKEPVLFGEWIAKGTHINAVGSSTPHARELDTTAILNAELFTDCYESLFNEAGDFLIPKKEGAIVDEYVRGEIGEVLIGKKTGRTNNDAITIFKSLGIASEDLFAACHIYRCLTGV